MNAIAEMENDRKFGLVRVTALHRDLAYKAIHDENGNMLIDPIVTEIVATLIAEWDKANKS